MRPSQTFMRLWSSIACIAGLAEAGYTIEDVYNSTNFFSEFGFFTGTDPTGGFVKYASSSVANTASLGAISNNAVYLGVDHTTVNPEGGRAAVRLSSNKNYTHGLFVADISHMPGGICGVWPAFWTFGPNWPSSGEIDIIEGVNLAATDTITLHTSSGCTMSNTGSISSSNLTQSNCNAGNGDDGCGSTTADTRNFGAGFNANGGGVYAMEWTSLAISVWFFVRSSIPEDIASGNPNPSGWGAPTAEFSGSGCDIDQHFMKHNIVFDTTFCGQWAGKIWSEDKTCSALGTTCDGYVGATPAAFAQAYWMINSVKVYQAPTAAGKRHEGGVFAKAFKA